MENYPSNSRRPKADEQEPKKVEKIVSGEVTRVKKPLGRRFLDTFFGGDDAHSVWSYILRDVLVPAAKDMVSEAVSQGIDRKLYGDSRGRSSSRPRGGSSSYVAYNRIGGSNPVSRVTDPRRTLSNEARATHNFDQVLLDTRAEAEAVLEQMYDFIEKYEIVTVADLYEMLGIVASFVDQKWGWVDMRGSRVTRVQGRWLLDLPKPEPIN